MTTEEKAKAYDEALERARKQRDEYQKEFDKTDKDSRLASILRAAISAVEMAFPELAESEDERIRRKMLEHFRSKTKETWCNIPVKDIIAYLEKQKEEGYEAIPVESTLEYKLGFKAGKESEKQKEQNEELVYRLNGLMQDYIKEGKDDEEKEHRLKCYQLFWDALEDTNFFEQKEQKPLKVGENAYFDPNTEMWFIKKEQKSVEPSDDEIQRHQDELYNFKVFATKQAREYHISFVHDFEWNNFCAGLLSYFNEKQNFTEWNEEDETRLTNILIMLKEYVIHHYSKDDVDKSVDWLENRVKFFRPQKLDASKLENFDPVEVLHRIKKEWPMAWEKVVPIQMWSEEEIKDLAHILKILDDCYIYGKHDLSKTDRDNLTDTIKSLKPSWKPSEHQMNILKAVKDYVGVGSGYWGEGLGSLIDDLEKLM